MRCYSPLLWQKALDALSPKHRDVIPPHLAYKPEELLLELDKCSSQSKGKLIRLPNGETFFVRDVLEKTSRWVRNLVAVGDAVVQYDPGHAALPWAAVRLILQVKCPLEAWCQLCRLTENSQMSMNNLDKHAMVLEGIEKISYYLVWSKIEESSLAVPYDAHDRLEGDFIKLYTAMLMFMARCIRFLRNKPRQSISL